MDIDRETMRHNDIKFTKYTNNYLEQQIKTT